MNIVDRSRFSFRASLIDENRSTGAKSFEICYFQQFDPALLMQLFFFFFGKLMECLLDIGRIIAIERLIAFNRAT